MPFGYSYHVGRGMTASSVASNGRGILETGFQSLPASGKEVFYLRIFIVSMLMDSFRYCRQVALAAIPTEFLRLHCFMQTICVFCRPL